jgi:hypothetical protein
MNFWLIRRFDEPGRDLGIQQQFVFLRILYWLEGLASIGLEGQETLQKSCLAMKRQFVAYFVDTLLWEQVNPVFFTVSICDWGHVSELIKFDANVIAQQITLSTVQVFQKIKSEEFLHMNWTRLATKHQKSPNVVKMMEQLDFYVVCYFRLVL